MPYRPVALRGRCLPGVEPRRQTGSPGGVEPTTSTVTASRAKPLHHGLHRSVIPGGLEPPISSASGRRRRRWATGSGVPQPGFEPGMPRSKRGVMVRFTTGASVSGRGGSRTLRPVAAARLSRAARRTGIRLPSVSQWTRRELNPDHRHAGTASSRWTTGPLQWSHRELHPDFPRAKRASSCWTTAPLLPVTEVGVEPTQLRFSA